ncbi:holo-ACP synthase [Brevibacillus invocatus]|uniref:Holo-[acyl-carrier-protein] synthase n=1 Tax=Brevibacillus invocatus TaxID=173959 RepID=A0A3M8C3S8_9BACL|nr:holo-ACP synthase [Brevibacillus invocatus]MCM3079245.1 holo-ACP synthase [Brevibacillus invocatus]MCM3429343.1 holo-ACP synthase [Brevibacillus invocatus]RNB70352.1 holo-[acyl-carrier-protein] synthase [Brevibacillus invocatus]
MIVGIGIDLVEIERIAALMKRQSRALDRILTIQERSLLEGKSEGRQIEFVAGRFAAKEAASKALGTGIGSMIGFLDMEVLPNEWGKPELKIDPEVFRRLGLDPSHMRVHLSISHSTYQAMAQVLVEEL